MKTGLLLILALSALLCSGCSDQNPDNAAELLHEREHGRGQWPFYEKPGGMLTTDPYGRDVAGWYRQSYKIWQVDHKRLRAEIEDENFIAITTYANFCIQDMRNMQRALPEAEAKKVEEMIESYGIIKDRARGNNNITGSLWRMDEIHKYTIAKLIPARVQLKSPDEWDLERSKDAPEWDLDAPKEEEKKPEEPK